MKKLLLSCVVLFAFLPQAWAQNYPVYSTPTPPTEGSSCDGYPGLLIDEATGDIYYCDTNDHWAMWPRDSGDTQQDDWAARGIDSDLDGASPSVSAQPSNSKIDFDPNEDGVVDISITHVSDNGNSVGKISASRLSIWGEYYISFEGFNSCSALETDAAGHLVCGTDDTGGGGGGGGGGDYARMLDEDLDGVKPYIQKSSTDILLDADADGTVDVTVSPATSGNGVVSADGNLDIKADADNNGNGDVRFPQYADCGMLKTGGDGHLICAVEGEGIGDVSAVGPACDGGECYTDGHVTAGTEWLTFEGETADEAEYHLAVPSSDPTSDRTWTFPDDTCTLACDDDVVKLHIPQEVDGAKTFSGSYTKFAYYKAESMPHPPQRFDTDTTDYGDFDWYPVLNIGNYNRYTLTYYVSDGDRNKTVVGKMIRYGEDPDTSNGDAGVGWWYAMAGNRYHEPMMLIMDDTPEGEGNWVLKIGEQNSYADADSAILWHTAIGVDMVDSDSDSTEETVQLTLNDVPYVWPSAQGAASTCLINDGSGNLSWGSCGSGGGGASGPTNDHNMWIGNGTTTLNVEIPRCDASTQKLIYKSDHTWSCETDATGGGGGGGGETAGHVSTVIDEEFVRLPVYDADFVAGDPDWAIGKPVELMFTQDPMMGAMMIPPPGRGGSSNSMDTVELAMCYREEDPPVAQNTGYDLVLAADDGDQDGTTDDAEWHLFHFGDVGHLEASITLRFDGSITSSSAYYAVGFGTHIRNTDRGAVHKGSYYAMFERNADSGATWHGVVNFAGMSSACDVDLGVEPTASWHTFRITTDYTAGKVTFYIDDDEKGSCTASGWGGGPFEFGLEVRATDEESVTTYIDNIYISTQYRRGSRY